MRSDANQRGLAVTLHSELIEKIPVGVIVLKFRDLHDPKTALIVQINSPAMKFIGTKETSLCGKTIADIPDLAKEEFLQQYAGVAETGISVDLGELRRLSEGAYPRVYSVRGFPLPGNCLGLAMEDITARLALEQENSVEEARFRLLVRGVRDCAIYMLDPAGYVLSWNVGAEYLKGYREEEILGKHFSVFYRPAEARAGKPQANLKEAADKGKCEEEGWRVRKDGSQFWAHVLITTLRDERGRLAGFAKVTRDITERQEREEALREANQSLELHVRQRTGELVRLNEKLLAEVAARERAQEQYRALAQRQEKVREEERTHVAREMHDELGQLCTALKMDLVWIAQKLPEQQTRLRERVDSALSLVSSLIQSLRRISAELRPSTLDSLGLVAAMEWQAQEFQARMGIACRAILPEKEVVLDQERSTAVFRIFQETLTNVARHANATSVQANLILREKDVLLVVHDDGRGFDAAYALNRGSPGLLGMRERANLIGGHFKISSSPGSGTTVTVQIPIRKMSKIQAL
jgi:PAS domain S-box-containing protein